MNELSRFKPLDHLPLAPGVCYLCKGGVGPFIDTSLTVDFEGAIYICIGCIKEMFSQLGLNSVTNEYEVQGREVNAYTQGAEAGRLEVMRQLSEFVNSRGTADSDAAAISDDSEPRTDSVASSGGEPQDKPESASDLVQSDGSISFQEPGIISGYTSDGKSLFDLD